MVVYSVLATGRALGRFSNDASPVAVRCSLADVGGPCRGQSSRSARYSSLFLLRPPALLTTRSKDGLLSLFMLSVKSMTSTSEPEAENSHPFLVGVCGTDSLLAAACTVCFHLLSGFVALAALLSACDPGPREMSRGLLADPGGGLSLAIAGTGSIVGRGCSSGSSGASVVASLISSSNAPSGMSSMSSRGVAANEPNEVVAGGSETSGGNDGLVESNQRR